MFLKGEPVALSGVRSAIETRAVPAVLLLSYNHEDYIPIRLASADSEAAPAFILPDSLRWARGWFGRGAAGGSSRRSDRL